MSVALAAASSQSLTVPTISGVKSIEFLVKPTADNEWLANLASGVSVVNGGIPIGWPGTATVYVAGAAVTQLGSELNSQANAASIDNEADATTGFVNNGMSTFLSSGVQAQSGLYSIHSIANSDGDHWYFRCPVIAGRRYRVAGYYYGVNLTSPLTAFWLRITTSDTLYSNSSFYQNGSWVKFEVVVIPTVTLPNMDTQFREGGDNNNADYFIDTLSVKEILRPLTPGIYNHVIITTDTAFDVDAGTLGKVGSSYGNMTLGGVAFYSAQISATQAAIKNNSGVPLSPLCGDALRDNLLAYYRMDNGNSLADATGLNAALTAFNSPVDSADVPEMQMPTAMAMAGVGV